MVKQLVNGEAKYINEVLSLNLNDARQASAAIASLSYETKRAVNMNSAKCGGDCKFCGWNRHDQPLDDPHIVLTANAMRSEVKAAQSSVLSPRLELMDSSVQARKKVFKLLENFNQESSIDFSGMGLHPGLMHPNRAEEYFGVMKRLGFVHYANNIETSPRHFSELVSSHTQVQKLASINFAKEHEFETHVGFILGLPGQTKKDLVDVVSLLQDLNPDAINLNFFYPMNTLEISKGYEIPLPDTSLAFVHKLRVLFPKTRIFLGAGQKEWFTGAGVDYREEARAVAGGAYVERFLNHKEYPLMTYELPVIQ